MLDKTFRPAEVEAKHYARWREAGAFEAHPDSASRPYTIMMPPPNVTGSLHMGHALTFTIQDILIRYHRMAGYDALWQPGTDHAGIATQMVVERNLAEEGVDRRDLGREKFLEKVWEWREESGGTILNQLTRLGASPDWARERFTMDDGLSAAVRKTFVDLYRQGLVYRDQRLVNWDPKLHTAISDLEVEQKEIDGHLWHFRYPVEGESERFIVVATTRPETMLGDTAVAVHPDDTRYQDLIGKHAILPLVDRRIPIVADEHADPEQGSGAVKITPAHDFNDFEVGRRHDLEVINVLDRDARINENAPDAYQGLDRYEARKRIVSDLEDAGLVEKIEEHRHTVPHGDRSGVAIEPWLTDQWYVDAATLAKPAIEAVEQGRTTFVPRQWENTYFEWMRNIQPWCVSRQIWWGHQIPAWYGPDGEIFVEMDEDAALAAAEKHYGKPVELSRETDVLDTWFSSALWPFSTLGWPEETPELQRYYPGDVLVTGFDIIFFWVARMMMMGLHFMGDVPFHTVYIHALVRDAYGQKMSKSKGNIIDPLDLIDKYGADAVRFTLAALSAQGRDIKLSESRVEGYRNFATKLWNAARYCEMNGAEIAEGFEPAIAGQKVNRWIACKWARMTRDLERALDDYKFNDAAAVLYHFVWGEFCDWYIEFTKPIINGDDPAGADECRKTMGWVLSRILHTLHPFMPFVTEELWAHIGDPNRMVITADWPIVYEGLLDEGAEAEIDWLAEVIGAIRAVRAEMNVPASAAIEVVLQGASETTRQRIERHHGLLCRLARLSDVRASDETIPAGSVQMVIGEATAAIPLADVIDLDKERARLQREADKLQGEIDKADKKLSNEQFLAKAPVEVIEEQKGRRAEAAQSLEKLTAALDRLKSA